MVLFHVNNRDRIEEYALVIRYITVTYMIEPENGE